ncbi:MAG: hypothetical protein RL007_2553 [Bacteroidota bacterium]
MQCKILQMKKTSLSPTEYVVQLKVEQLRSLVNEEVSAAISKLPHQKEEEELLKRKQVAKLFSVSLVTISDWCKTGKLPFHRINSRIFFKKSEVLQAMQSTQKYNRTQK